MKRRDFVTCAAGALVGAPAALGQGYAVWQGKLYSARVCSDPGCRMCASIERQLASQRVVNRVEAGRTYYDQPAQNLEANDEWVPLAMVQVDAMLDLCKPRPDDLIVDPGCGDARILTTACLKYGVKQAIGIEINPETADMARARVKALGLGKRINIVTADARSYSYHHCDVVYMYLYSDLINRLIKDGRFSRDSILVSYGHDFRNSQEVWHRGYGFEVA